MTYRTDDEVALLLAFILWLHPEWSSEQRKTSVSDFLRARQEKKA